MKAPTSQAYAAMQAEADRLSWPERFATDLTTHDRDALARVGDRLPLFWVLRRDGTFLCEISTDPIDGAGHFVWNAPAWFPRTFGPNGFRFYVWDGVALKDLGQDVDAAEATLRELAHERREREARAGVA